jgi:hypothetical protein
MVEESLRNVFAMAIVGVWILFPVGIVLTWRLIKRLEEKHRTVWADLGSPRLFLTEAKASINLFRFLWRDPNPLRDPRLSCLTKSLRWLVVAYGVLFLVAALAPPLAHISSSPNPSEGLHTSDLQE